MLRVILAHALLFAVPFIAYGSWVWLRDLKTEKTNLKDAPHMVLALIGVVLVIISLAFFANIRKMPEGTDYRHSRYEDGVFIPGGYE